MPPSVLHAQMDIIVSSPILQHQQVKSQEQNFSIVDKATKQVTKELRSCIFIW